MSEEKITFRQYIDGMDKWKKDAMTIAAVLGLLYGAFSTFETIKNRFLITEQKIRDLEIRILRNDIFRESLPLKERVDACHMYLELGGNSEAKIKCESLYKLYRDELNRRFDDYDKLP